TVGAIYANLGALAGHWRNDASAIKGYLLGSIRRDGDSLRHLNSTLILGLGLAVGIILLDVNSPDLRNGDPGAGIVGGSQEGSSLQGRSNVVRGDPQTVPSHIDDNLRHHKSRYDGN